MTVEGIDALLQPIRSDPSKLGSLLIGAGTWRAFDAFDQLLGLGISPDRLRVHLGHSRPTTAGAKRPFYRYHPMLHSKVYLFESSDGSAAAFIGSHNLTGFALCGLNGEAGVLLEKSTVAAEVCGATVWLGQYVDQLVASDQPAIQARGLTIAGFRQSNPDSDRILARNINGGFLGQVAASAVKCYQRAVWARHWLDVAGKTDDPIDFWRFSKLVEGVCDVRVIPAFRDVAVSALFKRYCADLFERLKKAAEERSKKRARTLFGLKAPESDIAMMIRNTLAPIAH